MNPLSTDLDHILAHTRGVWEELRGGRIFITGGTGFFGCWLLESFIAANDTLDLGAEAVVLTRDPEAFRRKAPNLACHSAIRFHVGDVRNFEFPEGVFGHVIHAASQPSPRFDNGGPIRTFDSIVEGTRRTLDFAAQAGAKRFLFTSSGAVYGRQPPELTHVPETYAGAPDLLDPRSAYGEGKRAAETLCCLYARRRGLEPTIARCFAFVGPYLQLDANFAVGNFIRDALRGGPIRIEGDGTPYRSYLYAADLAAWLWTILVRGAACRPYNVGSDKALTIAEVARMVAGVIDPKIEIVVARKAEPGKPAERYVPSIDRAREELGLEPWIAAADGVRRTADWHRRRVQYA
jgi:dTDP-glucose 4,6-dehydratase